MIRTLTLLCLCACTLSAPPPPEAQAPEAPDPLTAEALRATVEHLADDSYRGRETGTADIDRAARWLAAQLSQAGLAPAPGEDDLLWDYTLYRQGYDPDGTSLALDVGGEALSPRLGAAWRPFPFSDAGDTELRPVVFAGYGITAPEHGWDDYQGLDVSGKIVLLLRHEPGEDDPDSPFAGKDSSEHASFETKARNAAEHGAVGYLLVTDPLHHDNPDDLRVDGRLLLEAPAPGTAPQSQGPLFRAAHIDRPTAEALARTGGTDLKTLQVRLEAGDKPRDLSLGQVSARLSIARRDQAVEVPATNVVAVIPGATHPQERVVVGAHYDHIGAFEGNGDTVFNGADDNASGTAGLLALARAFALREQRPARTLVFVGFSGEEKGLLGSKAWVRDGGAEGGVFMLNLDMIGRNPDRQLEVYGDGYGTGVAELVTTASTAADLEVRLAGDDYFGASDHDPFYRRGVPFLFFFTGRHDDYHQLGDHADKLDYDRMERIVRAAYGVLEPVADGRVTPRFVHRLDWLGIRVDDRVIREVQPDSRATLAGLALGDRILSATPRTAVSDTDTDSAPEGGDAAEVAPEELDPLLRLTSAAPGTTLRVVVKRGEEVFETEVTRSPVGYLGVQPGEPSDERRAQLGLLNQQGVLLRLVLPEGPAEASGLREGDVLVQIADEPVSVRSLRSILERVGAGETVPVRLVRGTEVLTLQVTLGERPSR